MNSENLYYFNLIKQAISKVLLEHYSASEAIEDWKGEDIVNFQEDLYDKVKARVSEKWFYTYFKNNPQKLPRIDMLNLLSKYVGFDNWHAFKKAHRDGIKSKKKKNKTIYWLLIIIPIFTFVLLGINSKNQFHFCFIDDIKNEAITNISLDIKVLQNEESPLHFKTDSLGCFEFNTKEKVITFVVQSPYHKTDTIVRAIGSNENQTVNLQPDDYALMLHYYTSGNIKDWTKHKNHLENLIDDNAKIYQLFNSNIGLEIYTKDDFIRTLTIPTNSLKHIEILDKTFVNGKIVTLKFMVK